MPGRTPPRANPDGRDTDGSSDVPSFFATLLKLPISPLLTTVSTTNLIGAFAAVLTASHAFLIESFMEVKASLTPSVVRSNSGLILSRNQFATGAITVSFTYDHAFFKASRIVLNPDLMESMTREMIGQAVSRNQATTGAITRSLMKSHAVLSTARITLNPALISSITSEITGHTHVWNHD